MSKKHKPHRKRRPPRPEDAFAVLHGDVKDLATACAVHEIDAADDRRWLATHPKAEARHRPATSREVTAYGLPPGCSVVIRRGPEGSQIRMIFPPKK